ncbi:MAG TPA: hypothetical protein VNO21_25680 [Polyangiaceae bacterium]|nr:hypothetical protein [Polyangiaceae bacterium]
MTLRPLFFTWLLVPALAAGLPAVARAQTPPESPPPSASPTSDASSQVPPSSSPQQTPSASPAAPADSKPDTKTSVEFTSLRLLLGKGIITQAEYDAAVRDLSETSGQRAGDNLSFVVGKWATTLYGFIEGDTIYDSTQSLNEIAGNSQIGRPGTYGGDHDRTQFSVRNTRLGLRFKAPETNGIRATGQLEMDFLGTQLAFGGANAGTEASNYNNALMRVRHANLQIETPVVDVLIGQYWVLFGWHAKYLPATVELQGVPGEIFSRQMQVQISKTIKTDDVTFEIAVAAIRPPQRNSAVPAGQGGLRFAVNKWTAPQTLNLTGSSIQPLSFAVTADVRNVRLPELSATPKTNYDKVGASVAGDAFIPIIPGSKDHKGNSLALSGEVSTGYGSADMYTGQTGGVANPTLPTPAGATTAPVYPSDLDPGIATFDAGGQLHLVQWTSFIGGLQYYLPGSGNVFVSANYARTHSSNTGNLGAANRTRDSEDWFDFNLYWDATSAIRLAVEYANFNDKYNDGLHAINHRAQFSGAFLF